jgi:catechol 2,3-dioxygenase-like lactoylglutathione lyase family enzyme
MLFPGAAWRLKRVYLQIGRGTQSADPLEHENRYFLGVHMRNRIRGASLFAAGMIAGAFLLPPGTAQQGQMVNLGVRVNHVGIWVKNFEESIDFYTKTLGFREAFVFRDKEGRPTTMYVQVNKDTFLELAPATAERPAGLNHIGFWADDLNSTVAKLRQQGVKVDDPRTGASKAPLTNVTDPNGIRLELLEFAPDSLQRKAIDSWK